MLILFKTVFLYLCIGFLLSRIAPFSLRKFATLFFDLVIYILFPLFVFFSVWTVPVIYHFFWAILLAALGVIAVGIGWAFLFSRLFKVSFREHFLPIVFINSGYLGVPVNTFLFGATGTVYAILFDIIPTLSMFSLGVFLIAPRNRLKEIIRIPLVYAALVGLLLNYYHVSVPSLMLYAIQALKEIIIPAILIMVGYSLSTFEKQLLRQVIVASCFRFIGGLLAGLLFVYLLHLEGVIALVCIVSASMPSAVNSYILAEKYQMNPRFSAQVVTISTMISIPYIMLLSLLLR